MALVKTLIVNQGDIHYGSLFHLPRGSVLRLKKGPTLYGVPSARIFTNHPEEGVDFDRRHFRPLEWNVPRDASGCELIMADHTVDLPIASSGSFRFYLQIDGEKDVIVDFVVDPIFTMGKSGELLPMDCIQCVTVLPKSLGPLPEWEGRLRVLKETGYNMIHFTPVQELGGSLSSYSLRNQHKLNPMFGEGHKMEDLAKLVRKMETEWKVLSICDIVLNHTANESEWLLEHPEATFNVHNMPHLRPAYLFDRLFWRLSCEVAERKWVKYGVPPEIASEEHLQNLKKLILQEFLPLVRIHELFMVDADHIVQALRDVLRADPPTGVGNAFGSPEFRAQENQIVILQDPEYRRFRSTVEFDLAVRTYGVSMVGFSDQEARLNAVCGAFKAKLEALNHQKFLEVQRHLEVGIDNVLAQNRYRRFDPNGPKEKKVTQSAPITGMYFYVPPNEPQVHLEDEESKVMHTARGKFRMAHNGWVMNHDPLVNFALPGSNVYLRRELIEWGDSVKLRYGEAPQDSPFLWDYMRTYVVETAKTFHGLRLDNCHSTPLNVAEYLLDEARKVNPNLYVIAELFTNSLATDNVFVARLGINSLIREALSAHNSQEEGRLVYFYGGKPVGSFDIPSVSPLTSVVAHAIFFDQTHDNECPMLKRSVYDALPSAALVSMASCASGSTRGYDELVPHMIHVVNETRFYTSWGAPDKPGFVDASCGIIAAKKALNDLHYELGSQGFSELFVDQKSSDVVAVTRHCPSTRRSVILVAHTAFASNMAHGYHTPGRLGPVTGYLTSIRLAARFYHKDAPEPWNLEGIDSAFLKDWKPDENFVTGLRDFRVDLQERVRPEECDLVEISTTDDGKFFVDFKIFPPGSIVALEVSLDPSMEDALKDINAKLANLESDLTPVLDSLELEEFNFILFRCEAEQRAETPDRGCYGLSNGALVYSGLQGFMSVLDGVENRNDQGHPVCQNLREGPWMLDYVASHFGLRKSTTPIGQWLESYFASVKRLPNYLAPCYFAKVLRALYNLCCSAVFRQMPPFIKDSGEFVKALALSSLQFLGVVSDGELPSYRKDGTPDGTEMCSLSAGLPHFSTGYMRNWGRDTFISLTGLCLLTGRFKDAKNIILSFASVLRHGLIPNLLNKGSGSRYNARDAVWFWLYSIQRYVQIVPNGIDILKEPVARHYLKDDDPWGPGEVEMALEEVMQEALERHFEGEKFRERNAGGALDRVMKSEGFNNEIGVDPETGFVFGGNQHNCGTWMDKMGSSERAGNIGIPATPRNGSAVELVGLCYATVKWLDELSSAGKYSFPGVEADIEASGGGKAALKWSWKDWAEKIRKHFDEYFYMEDDPSADRPHQQGKLFVRGVYQDSLNSFPTWADFQARPNFFVALSVAPDMVKHENALRSLECGGELLEGPLGMRTLSLHDSGYRPDYYNSETDDFSTSCGLNYHNGPEWVWPRGFYLNAILEHAERSGNAELLQDSVKKVFDSLKRLWWLLLDSESNPWKGLPELTNRDGSYCAASCRTQAWSVATILEVAHKLDQIKRRNKGLSV